MLTIKIPERRQWGCSGVSIVDFEQVNVSWEHLSQVIIKHESFLEPHKRD